MARNLNAMVRSHVDAQMRFVGLMLECPFERFDHRRGERQKFSDRDGRALSCRAPHPFRIKLRQPFL